MRYAFNRQTAAEVSKALGKRPGKTVDAEYLRKSGFAGKYMFWDEETGKYITPVPYDEGIEFEVIDGQPPRMIRG
jgi:hypothetical protein